MCGPVRSMADEPVFGAAPPGVVCHPRDAAYAVVARSDGRVAAISFRLRDGTDRYWLPGGGVEPGESAEETVVREAREELGRGVSVHGPLGRAVQYFYAADEDRWYEMTATFVRATLDASPRNGGEYDLHWVDAHQDGRRFFYECHVWAASQVEER
jgi:8-oxo-dGTP diphosphatase